MSPKKMSRVEGIDEEIEKEVEEAVKLTVNKVDKTLLKELPDGQLSWDEKLFELKKNNDKNRELIIKGLQHLEKKIDHIYNTIKGKR